MQYGKFDFNRISEKYSGDGSSQMMYNIITTLVLLCMDPYNARIFVFKPWEPKGFFNLKSS